MFYERERKIHQEKYLIDTIEKRYMYENLTLENLAKKVKPNEIFDITQINTEGEDYYLIEVHIQRYETDEEQAKRIRNDEIYNKNRLAYLAKQSK